jgi:hypothetical protein
MAAEEEPKFEKPAAEQKPEEEGFKKEGDLWVPKEERGHIRSAQEVERAREEIPEEKKIESAEEREERKEREWKYGTRTLERIRRMTEESDEDKKEMEAAETPEKEMEAEDILKEVGGEKAVEETKKEQEKREEKISSLRDVKKVGKERLDKLMDGLAYVAALDKLGLLGLKAGKKIAIESGKNLMAIGLSPAVALEEAGREIFGQIQRGGGLKREVALEEELKRMQELPENERTEHYPKILEFLQSETRRVTEIKLRGYDKMFGKGKVLSFLEKQGGAIGRDMSERLTPHPSGKEASEEQPKVQERAKTVEEMKKELMELIGSEGMKKLDDLEGRLQREEISREDYWGERKGILAGKENRDEKIDWLEKGIKDVKKGNIPAQITIKLENYLKEHDVTQDEIKKMKPMDAWKKAMEIYNRK